MSLEKKNKKKILFIDTDEKSVLVEIEKEGIEGKDIGKIIIMPFEEILKFNKRLIIEADPKKAIDAQIESAESAVELILDPGKFLSKDSQKTITRVGKLQKKSKKINKQRKKKKR